MSHTTAGRRTAGLSLALALALTVAGLSQSPASAVPPGAPSGLGVAQPNVTTTILSWSHSPTATKYEVLVDDTADFTSPLVRQTTTNATFVPKDQFPVGGLNWRVRAINAQNESSDWSFGQFTQGRLAAPELSSPTSGQPVVSSAPPVLSWGLVPGASDYKVEVSREDSFTPANTRTFATQSTSVVPSKTLEKGTWFWRVTASRASGLTSTPSSIWTFVMPTLPAPILLSPANAGPDPVEDVVLRWDPVPGAEKYQVDISRDRDFPGAGAGVMNGPDWVTMPRATAVGAAYSPEVTIDNGVTWYWRVRALDFDGNTGDWQATPFVFRRAWGDRTAAAHGSDDLQDIPTLLFPADPATETLAVPFGFSWTAVQHASDYEVNVGTTDNFSPGTFTRCRVQGTSYTPYQFRVNVITGSTSKSIDDNCVPSPGRNNYWRVRPLDRPFAKAGVLPGVQGEFSDTQAFYWNPTAMTNLQPTSGATVSTPTVSWDAVTGAEKYKVEITDGTGATVRGETNSTSYTMLRRPAAIQNPYTWSVAAVDAAGNPVSAVYTSMTFNLVESAGQAEWANLSSTTPTLRAPDLRWAPITGADYYRVQVRRSGEGWLPGSSKNVFASDIGFPAVTDTSDELFTAGPYFWRVTAYTQAGGQIGTASPEWQFEIAALPAVTGQKLALDAISLGTTQDCEARLFANGVDGPRCNPVPSTPVLSWSRVPGASFYQVWVNTDASFTTPMEPEAQFPATSNTMYVPNLSNGVSAFPDNDATVDSAYYWAIVPCKSTKSCASSIRGELGNATNAFVKKSPATRLTAPADQATVTASELTFTWEDYLRTNQTVPSTGSATGEASTQSAMQYRIEIATDLNFQDVLESTLVDQTTYTSAARLYPEGPLYWRVRAVDGDENELTWSTPRRVDKRNPLPVLQEPAAGGWASPTVTLRWDAMPALDGYLVEVYRNNQVSPTNLVTSCSTTSATAARYPALSCAKPLAPTTAADTTDQYRWRIRRVDSTGLANPWSAERTFEVSGSSLTLTSPSPGAAQDPNGPVLAWNPVDGATEYRMDLRNETTGQNLTPVTTIATAHAVTTNVTSGTYRWSVTAFNAGGGAVATSSRTFTVDAGLTASSGVQIHAPEGSAVGRTLTSTAPVWNRDGVQNTYQWLRNGSPISGATGTTYTLTVADYTRAISLRVTGEKPGFTDGTSVSNLIGATAGGALQSTTQPAISGVAKVGETLMVTNGAWTPSATRYTYQWLRTGAPIPNATTSRYRLTPEDAGKNVSVTVLASATGFTDGAASAAAVAVPKMVSTTTATLSATRIKPGTRAKLGITVAVPGVTGPAGLIKVMDGTKAIKTVTLFSIKNGKITLKLPKLAKGKHRIRAKYLGDATTQGSQSKGLRLSVLP